MPGFRLRLAGVPFLAGFLMPFLAGFLMPLRACAAVRAFAFAAAPAPYTVVKTTCYATNDIVDQLNAQRACFVQTKKTNGRLLLLARSPCTLTTLAQL